MVIILLLLVISFLLFLLFKRKKEEIYYIQGDLLIRVFFNSPQKQQITDFSLYEKHNIIGIDYYETRENEEDDIMIYIKDGFLCYTKDEFLLL